MKLNTNSLAACTEKLIFLGGRWHGSSEATLAFGRECANSRQWGGEVPLALAHAHRRLANHLPAAERTNYWRRPETWRDVKKSFDTYFVRNPTQQARNGQFALFAFQCEQWDAFVSHVNLLSKAYREHFFEGPENVDAMLRYAKARSTHRRESPSSSR